MPVNFLCECLHCTKCTQIRFPTYRSHFHLRSRLSQVVSRVNYIMVVEPFAGGGKKLWVKRENRRRSPKHSWGGPVLRVRQDSVHLSNMIGHSQFDWKFRIQLQTGIMMLNNNQQIKAGLPNWWRNSVGWFEDCDILNAWPHVSWINCLCFGIWLWRYHLPVWSWLHHKPLRLLICRQCLMLEARTWFIPIPGRGIFYLFSVWTPFHKPVSVLHDNLM